MNIWVRGKTDKKFFLKTYTLHIPYYEVKAVLKIIYKIKKKILKSISGGLFLESCCSQPSKELHGPRPSFNLSVPWIYYCQNISLSVSIVTQTENRKENDRSITLLIKLISKYLNKRLWACVHMTCIWRVVTPLSVRHWLLAKEEVRSRIAEHTRKKTVSPQTQGCVVDT